MAKYDFYKKRGNLNYKERSMLEEISARIIANPELAKDITPANNFDELKSLHMDLTTSVAEVIEETKTDEEVIAPKTESKKPFLDPMNREEPNVRDYVMEDKFDPFADFNKAQRGKSEYIEPQNFNEAFDLPDSDEMSGNKQSSSSSSSKSNKPSPRPVSDDVSASSGSSRRKAKRFAASIVNATCDLFEVGFQWYATKDINENKLAEYEMSGEMDLSLLVDLPSGHEVTIKEFFLNQLDEIEQASKIPPHKREGLIESCTELFVEKNIQPSASYSVLIDGVTILAEQGIKLMMITSQNTAILNQLRERGGTAPQSSPRTYAPRSTNDIRQQQSEFEREQKEFQEQKREFARQQQKQYESELKSERSRANQYFEVEPSESIIERASRDILLSDMSLEEEIANDLSLLDEFQTKE